ncbi:predicted protein [Phaeodactylum tricornutum CCAP 1055/1]|jgi:hypothetical protein|uniref:BZIP domain-containing protein n=1 Tax=Phaeodactylum tricornutum (strain CCAP 1055/1) TaxID=556484 RepID=B5Y3B6_PHATC|nr:predicted protein [Phaeodactylum tricornutum CCAP 1055/1]ACI65090.1 predicted protein [Phaeodactylum tricornutum CCAP 1055/1]|eukprot:XP_002185620.1 predicted protein [Phaeodactylum tricornutum CCAP 1055/1]
MASVPTHLVGNTVITDTSYQPVSSLLPAAGNQLASLTSASVTLHNAGEPHSMHANQTNIATSASSLSCDESLPLCVPSKKRTHSSRETEVTSSAESESRASSSVEFFPHTAECNRRIPTRGIDSQLTAQEQKQRHYKPTTMVLRDSQPLSTLGTMPDLGTMERQLHVRPGITPDVAKTAAKREYNRRNAARVRMRNKGLVSDLQKKIANLAQHEAELQRANEVLQAKVEVLEKQYQDLLQARKMEYNGAIIKPPPTQTSLEALLATGLRQETNTPVAAPTPQLTSPSALGGLDESILQLLWRIVLQQYQQQMLQGAPAPPQHATCDSVETMKLLQSLLANSANVPAVTSCQKPSNDWSTLNPAMSSGLAPKVYRNDASNVHMPYAYHQTPAPATQVQIQESIQEQLRALQAGGGKGGFPSFAPAPMRNSQSATLPDILRALLQNGQAPTPTTQTDPHLRQFWQSGK